MFRWTTAASAVQTNGRNTNEICVRHVIVSVEDYFTMMKKMTMDMSYGEMIQISKSLKDIHTASVTSITNSYDVRPVTSVTTSHSTWMNVRYRECLRKSTQRSSRSTRTTSDLITLMKNPLVQIFDIWKNISLMTTFSRKQDYYIFQTNSQIPKN